MDAHTVESSLIPRRQPFLYLTATLLAGILTERWAEPSRPLLLSLAAICIVLSAIFILLKKPSAATLPLIAGFILAGALLSNEERNSVKDSRLVSLFEQGHINAEDPVSLMGRLSTLPEPAPDAFYLDLEAESLQTREEVISATGHARLVVPIRDGESRLDFERLRLDYGSRIRVLVRLERARAFANPGSPDFNQFLEQKGYDLKGTLKSPLLIENMGSSDTNPLLVALYHLRLRCLKALDAHFKQPVAGTLKAVLIGNRYYLDETTEERLREGATFHILSISGMHVAIIAWVLLGRWSPSKRKRAARVIVSLLALWAYAVMAGLSPPVTRATLMITVGLIGPLLFRPSVSINTVALAAFAMLALKPALVADPGFQLSFVAVAAIVAIAVPVITKLRLIGDWRPTSDTPHPPRCMSMTRRFAEILFWNERAFNREMSKAPFKYRLDKSRLSRLLNRLYIQPVLRGICVLVITSAAIQLATLPLSIFYFNRVAPIGILLNVVAGLLTVILMLSGIVATLIGAVSNHLAMYITFITDAAHYLLVNQIAPFLNIPGATFRVAHYEGLYRIIYALFFVPLTLLVILIDRWQPVEEVKIKKRKGERGKGREGDNVKGGIGAESSQHLDNRSPAISSSSQTRRVSTSPIRPFSHSPFLSLFPSSRSHLLPVLCALSLIIAMVVVIHPVSNVANGKLRVYFLDVGQGDAALVVFPQGTTMLVDGGGEPDFRNTTMGDNSSTSDEEKETEQPKKNSGFSIGETVVSRFLWAMGLNHIDYVLVTHPHVDHIQGLTSVVHNFKVGQAIIARTPTDNSEFDRFVMVLTDDRVPTGFVRTGENFEIEGAQIEVLWPPAGSGSDQIPGNDDSIVLRLVYGSTRILLTGDIEQAAETSLVKSGFDLRADAIKTPHHGSRTSSSGAFLDAVQPRFAVISVGERNRFGHPHPEVVERYMKRSVTLFETRRDGMITVETDGVSLNVQTYR